MNMHITRWNLMGLALVALVLNSGLAQSDSISSVSPPSVQPDPFELDTCILMDGFSGTQAQ